MTPEKKVKTKAKKILDELGCYYFMPATGGYGASGVPDIIACYKGKFFGIECKANGNKPTMLQIKHLTDILKAGGQSMVIDEHNVGMLELFITGKQTFNLGED
jgi:Holliday junction resolvase